MSAKVDGYHGACTGGADNVNTGQLFSAKKTVKRLK